LDAFLDSGGAIEACARKLFVHPNTVRYRLKRIGDFTGRDPAVPRDAYVLRVASTAGRLSKQAYQPNTPAAGTIVIPAIRPAHSARQRV
ncbi:PucR family transcriptional regulator, partial [Streptomyces edwardsiae]